MHFSIDRTVHTTAFDKPVVDHWFVIQDFVKEVVNVMLSDCKQDDT